MLHKKTNTILKIIFLLMPLCIISGGRLSLSKIKNKIKKNNAKKIYYQPPTHCLWPALPEDVKNKIATYLLFSDRETDEEFD